MIPAIPTGSDLLLLPLMASLPVMISIQLSQPLASSARRVPHSVGPRSPSVKRLIKALNIHPLTTSFSIRFTARDLPELTMVREVAKDEMDAITDWVKAERIETIELVGYLQSEEVTTR
jgi:ribosomal protein L16 Arg81 hydroxylase